MKEDVLYPLQEAVLVRLQSMGDPQFDIAKLCGGTALSRCWFGHRVSYDLDFFLPYGFKAADMATALKKAGIEYETKDLVDDPRKANQLHGYVIHEGQRLKVSFVEDAYFETFPAVTQMFGKLLVRTEEIPGLYHRKLRTVAGRGDGEVEDSFEGGRQKARDLFDLHVLSLTYMPIQAFMDALPYPFPSGSFDNGLVSMPWFDLIDELGEIVCDPKWSQAKDIEYLQEALYSQIGATCVSDDLLADDEEVPGSSIVKRSRAWGCEMKTLNSVDSWESVGKKVYWDRDISLEKWREMVSKAHRSYFPDAITVMSVSEFVYFYGVAKFKADWPKLRAQLPEKAVKKAYVYDAVWSKLVGGGWNLRPSPDFYAMPERRRQFLIAIAKKPGCNIYEIGNSLGMQYRRAHEHAKNLTKMGALRSQAIFERGRRKIKLFPAYGKICAAPSVCAP